MRLKVFLKDTSNEGKPWTSRMSRHIAAVGSIDAYPKLAIESNSMKRESTRHLYPDPPVAVEVAPIQDERSCWTLRLMYGMRAVQI